MSPDTHAVRTPFGETLRTAIRPHDLLIITTIPILLIAIYLLPAGLRETLTFTYTDPSIHTAFTANYIHLEAFHLLANIGAYLLIVPLIYLLSILSGHRNRFFIVFTTFLLAFPIALSMLNLAVFRPGSTHGFSGITMAFLGYLPIALASFLKTNFNVDAEFDLAGALFCIGLALIAILTTRSLVTAGLAVSAILAAVLFALTVADRHSNPRPDIRGAIQAGGYFELAAIAFILFAALPMIAFPSDPVNSGTIVNLYVHMLGYALGFLVSYTTLQLMPCLNQISFTPMSAA